MNFFELLMFWVVSLCGLAVFKAVEAKAGFWGGSLFFMLGAGGAYFLVQLLAGLVSRKPRQDGGGNRVTSEKEQK
jgi:hypothetical protein